MSMTAAERPGEDEEDQEQAHAYQIVDLMAADPESFTAPDGRTLDEICRAEGARVSARQLDAGDEVRGSADVEEVPADSEDFDRIRYLFADGSAVLVVPDEMWGVEDAARPWVFAGVCDEDGR